jgi:hypothetical protein
MFQFDSVDLLNALDAAVVNLLVLVSVAPE